MDEYEVIFQASAAKEFRDLPLVTKQKIALVIDKLKRNPRSRQVRKLTGKEGLYRIRVGHYRIVYEIDDRRRLIRVTRIRHRKDVY
jgi:mRNA interferase RelE/StbE